MSSSRGVVVVVGMHRSGTSCLAGSLQARGLDLGAVSESDPHNVKGNRESLEVRELNEEVLAQSAGSWLVPPEVVRWDGELARRRDRFLASQAADPVTKSGTWGFKDPRTLVTLPFWLEALAEPRYVATFRHPLAVARSLQRRDGLPPAQGVDLWLAYNRRLADLWRERPFPVVSFDLGTAAYRRAVDRMAAGLGLRGGPTGADFRRAELIHQAAADDGDLAAAPRALLAELRRMAEAS
jgi:hypothetical protein